MALEENVFKVTLTEDQKKLLKEQFIAEYGPNNPNKMMRLESDGQVRRAIDHALKRGIERGRSTCHHNGVWDDEEWLRDEAGVAMNLLDVFTLDAVPEFRGEIRDVRTYDHRVFAIPSEFKALDNDATVTPDGGTQWSGVVSVATPLRYGAAVFGFSDGKIERSTDGYAAVRREVKPADGDGIERVWWERRPILGARERWWQFWRVSPIDVVVARTRSGATWESFDDGETWERETYDAGPSPFIGASM